jgi:uncharacterized protein YkwD
MSYQIENVFLLQIKNFPNFIVIFLGIFFILGSDDIAPPVITILGDNPVIIMQGEMYIEAGASADDAVDGEVKVITTGLDKVNTSILGTYIITYSATDLAGNIATAKREVRVVSSMVDIIPPEIKAQNNTTITDEETLVFLLSDSASGLDINDPHPLGGDVKVKINGVDANSASHCNDYKEGKFTLFPCDVAYISWNKGVLNIVIEVVDKAGNKTTKTFTYSVNIIAKSYPLPDLKTGIAPHNVLFSFMAKANTTIKQYEWDFDGDGSYDLSKSITANQGWIAPNTYKDAYVYSNAGTFNATLRITDSTGNKAIGTVKIVVSPATADKIPPVITIKGENPVTIEKGSTYIDAGATAFDNIDGVVTVSKQGSVDTNIVDMYVITYTAIDKTKNKAEAKRTVNVIEKTSVYKCPATVASEASYIDSFISATVEDTPWSKPYGVITVTDIENIFNAARQKDNTIQGEKLNMPTQTAWDAMSSSQKALYLLNSERCARKIRPYEGIDPTIVATPAQFYANYLSDNDLWSHTADGRTPWERLAQDAGVNVGVNADFFSYAENLAYTAVGSTGSYPTLYEPVTKAVYAWIYADKEDTNGSYGHRKFALAIGLTENSGDVNQEGLIGVGVKTKQYEKSGFLWTKIYTVLNAFDPNGNWDLNNMERVDLEKPDACFSPYHLVTVGVPGSVCQR